jgi:hypothetical protein
MTVLSREKASTLRADHLLLLQPSKNPVKNAVSTPAAHAAGVDAVPIAEIAWKTSPFAPMFEDVQHREVVNCDIASLTQEDIGYFFVLLQCYFHRATITQIYWFIK